MNSTINIIIVEKPGTLKNVSIKNFQEGDLYKKCGLKKADGFNKQNEWNVKIEGKKYIVELYGKTEGKANTENKYDFPPPVDTILFFGNCALVCKLKKESTSTSTTTENSIVSDFSIELWNKMYEKLFGGFEDLTTTCAEDEEEIDELENISSDKKTKHGYLKDGFVVDSDENDEDYNSDDDSEELDDSEESNDVEEDELKIEDIGSELSEDEYDYSDNEES